MLVARNLGYMSQVHSTMNYSRKLAALGRLTAGVAHEVKNPLNAMMIHLELVKRQAVMRQPVVRGRAEAVRGRGCRMPGARRGRSTANRKHVEDDWPGRDSAAR